MIAAPSSCGSYNWLGRQELRSGRARGVGSRSTARSSLNAEQPPRKKPPRRTSSSSIDSPRRVPAVSGSHGSRSSDTLKHVQRPFTTTERLNLDRERNQMTEPK